MRWIQEHDPCLPGVLHGVVLTRARGRSGPVESHHRSDDPAITSIERHATRQEQPASQVL